MREQVITNVPNRHQEWRAVLRRAVESMVAPSAEERFRESHCEQDLLDAFAELGVYRLMIGDGEHDADLEALCIALEEVARVDCGLAGSIHAQAVTTSLLQRLCLLSETDADELLAGLGEGKEYISFALTEPRGGSDAKGMETTAIQHGNDWILKGSKSFITNPGLASTRHILLFARSGDTGISAFLVPKNAPGVVVGPAYDKLSWRTSDTHPVYFDDVRVPSEALIGPKDKAFAEAFRFLVWTRVPISAMGSGIASGCLSSSVDFVAGRSSFGSPLGSHQGVSFQLAELASLAHIARLVTYEAVSLFGGPGFDHSAALAKLVSSEAANRAAYIGTQIHGGAGCMNDSLVTRHYADARVLTIGEGTSEVQKILIARALGFGQG